jgi:hypothetical protein
MGGVRRRAHRGDRLDLGKLRRGHQHRCTTEGVPDQQVGSPVMLAQPGGGRDQVVDVA